MYIKKGKKQRKNSLEDSSIKNAVTIRYQGYRISKGKKHKLAGNGELRAFLAS